MSYNLDTFLDLIAKELAGTISADEKKLFSKIISAHPEAAAEYAQQLALYRSWGFGRSAADKNKQQHPLKVVAVNSTKHWRKIEIMKAAAVLLLIASGIWVFHYGLPTFGGRNPILAFSFGNREDSAIHTVETFRGKEDSVSLSDGSTVRINAASRLRVQFSKDKRKVEFKGEAYFRVAPGRRPFIINTPYATIEVLGTEFNVNTYDSGVTKISLVKGKIRVRAMNKDIIVHAGEELIYTHGNTFQLRQCMCNVTLAWQHGVCHFFNENLRSIAPRLERLFDTCVVVDDERLLDKTYTGMIYKSTGLKENIHNMQALIKFNYYFAGDTLHITSK